MPFKSERVLAERRRYIQTIAAVKNGTAKADTYISTLRISAYSAARRLSVYMRLSTMLRPPEGTAFNGRVKA